MAQRSQLYGRFNKVALVLGAIGIVSGIVSAVPALWGAGALLLLHGGIGTLLQRRKAPPTEDQPRV